jgi:hypothetical protein
MEKTDKQDLQMRLENFSHGDETYMKITRIEADYLQNLVNEDWRK